MPAGQPQERSWQQSFTRKRIIHQWLRVVMLGETRASRVLGLGPDLRCVTAMIKNAGYDMGTLDFYGQAFSFPQVSHIVKVLTTVTASQLRGCNAIICCETLEHVDKTEVGDILRVFKDSGDKYFIVSVPDIGFQCWFKVYFNFHALRQSFPLKKFNLFRRFQRESVGEHQWEIGYKGHRLSHWEEALRDAGWRIIRREFTKERD